MKIMLGQKYIVPMRSGDRILMAVDAETLVNPDVGLSQGFIHWLDLDGRVVTFSGVRWAEENCVEVFE